MLIPADVTRTFSLHSIGCRLNHYEIERVGAQLESLGFQEVEFGQPADLAVINTCSVTSRADADGRRVLRQARRASPDGLVAATGCYASAFAREVEALGAVDLIVDNLEKDALVGRLVDLLGYDLPHATDLPVTPRPFGRHTRAMVKIQDGCQEACSYCIIPRARGRERSRPALDIVREVEALAAAGYREVVLTGVHAGKYRHEGHRLSDLVSALLDRTTIEQIRLSSLEPREFRPALVDLLSHPRVCPHLHVPIQSGHDAVLRRMRRSYDTSWVSALFEQLSGRADLALGTDVMVGFPGETEAEFVATRRFLESLPLAYLHVFAWSPRPGTQAAALPGKVPEPVVRERSRELRDLGVRVRQRFYAGFVGRTLPVLVERRRDRTSGRLVGLTHNYLRVQTEGPDEWMNRILPLRIERLEGDCAVALAA
jgi:threonylcarbamoyladenosine tRNA methylthiotransferase MtaB